MAVKGQADCVMFFLDGSLASLADVFFFNRLSQLFRAFLFFFFFQPVFLLIPEPPAKRPDRRRNLG